MPRLNYEFSSESVSEGHPDKVCDRSSDEIVDLFYREAAQQDIDPYRVRVACETMATTNRVIVAGAEFFERHVQFEHFLQQFRRDVFRSLLADVEAESDRINRRFQSGKWRPIVFLKRHYSHQEIARYYRAADLCLVTSLHDGMNLVAKEFVASRAMATCRSSASSWK